MKEKINQFLIRLFYKYNVWKGSLIFFPLITLFTGFIFSVVDRIFRPENPIPTREIFYLQIVVGLMCTILFVIFAKGIRRSLEFWNFCREVKDKIEEAESKDEIERIRRDEFQILLKKSMGGPHNTELIKIETMLTVKGKMLAKFNE
jgi:hypothetical protein